MSATTGTVHILLFGALVERFGTRELSVAAAPTVADLWAAIAGDGGRAVHGGVRAARNLSFCEWDTPVYEGDEVAFMSPVCGG